VLAEDWDLQHFSLLVQRRALYRALYSVFKDKLRRDQARRQEGVICKGKGDNMCNRAEDRGRLQ
jgi:hypothetical protein